MPCPVFRVSGLSVMASRVWSPWTLICTCPVPPRFAGMGRYTVPVLPMAFFSFRVPLSVSFPINQIREAMMVIIRRPAIREMKTLTPVDKPELRQAIPVHPKMVKKAMRFFRVRN